MAADATQMTPWDQVEAIIESGDRAHLEAFLQLLPPADTAHTINRLTDESRTELLSLVRPELAAQLMEHLADTQAADLIEGLSPQGAAAIVDEMDSDDQADILSELDADDAEAILTHMDPAEAQDARRLVCYDPNTAGGIMISEYLAYRTDQTVRRVLEDLRDHVEQYGEYDVQYLYGIDQEGKLQGLIRIRDVVLSPGEMELDLLMVKNAVHVGVDNSIDELEAMFDRHHFNALPVVDADRQLVGVVRRDACCTRG